MPTKTTKRFRTTARRSSGRTTSSRNTRSSSSTSSTRATSAKGTWSPSAAFSPTKFNNQKKNVNAKIASFRTISQQFSGAGKVTAFSPTAANKWINLVNSGASVYKFNGTQFNRFFGKFFSNNVNSVSPTVAFKTLKKQFGSGIKAVTRGKGNNWLVASTTNTATPFKSYSFK